ncbi:MAG: OB-fold nucleic acid binding domain-containing protein [Chitinophagales bacterium]|nr:OB-fold nucleic acid binding domain-containing protein [Chitinophagales bacterium]
MSWIYIKEMRAHIGQEVTLKGWVANRRDSKGIAFVTMRDGTGFCQCVIAEDVVGSEAFEQTKNLSQETSLK